jgi:hypothetical protein
MIGGAVDTLSNLLCDKLIYCASQILDFLFKYVSFFDVEMISQSLDFSFKNVSFFDVKMIFACLILFFLLITAVLSSGQRDPKLINWFDPEEGLRTPAGLILNKRKAIDIPRPKDDTRNKKLAEIIHGQMMLLDQNNPLWWNNRKDLYSPIWTATPYRLNEEKKAELHRIAYEAESLGDLDKLGLEIKTTPEGTFLGYGNTDKAHASINVYLLVIGKATPEARAGFLALNPEYRRLYS